MHTADRTHSERRTTIHHEDNAPTLVLVSGEISSTLDEDPLLCSSFPPEALPCRSSVQARNHHVPPMGKGEIMQPEHDKDPAKLARDTTPGSGSTNTGSGYMH